MKSLLAVAALVFATSTLARPVGCEPQRDARGKIKRSAYQVQKFRKLNPCPATGLTTGRCKGYEVDHIVPLSCCGADTPANMQWLTIKAHDIKTIKDNQECRL